MFVSRRHSFGSQWEWAAVDDSSADLSSDAGSVSVPKRHDTTTSSPHQHSTCPDHFFTGTRTAGHMGTVKYRKCDSSLLVCNEQVWPFLTSISRWIRYCLDVTVCIYQFYQVLGQYKYNWCIYNTRAEQMHCPSHWFIKSTINLVL